MSESDQSGAGRREVAYRMFAAEYEDADLSYSESDEERAPNYVITPTGARANRLFIVGVLTEVEQVSEDVLRARVVDPTGGFVLYAGQYQPDEQAFLERADPPTFVAVTGKARTFSPDDSEQVYTSIRPESISEVDDDTRDRWTVQAAEQTVDRVGWMATALTLGLGGEELRNALVERGADDGLAHGVQLAIDHYGTTPTYLDAIRKMAIDAARVVADETDEVTPPGISPDTTGEITANEVFKKVPMELVEPAATESATAGQAESAAREGAQVSVEVGEAASGAASTEPEPDPTPASPDRSGAESPEAEQSAGSDVSTADSETAPTVSDETATVSDSPGDSEDEELGDFDGEEFELETETREEIEEEYGTDFQTGTEVDDPGEAGIETPGAAEDEPPSTEAADGDQPEPAPDPQSSVGDTVDSAAGETPESESVEEEGERAAEPTETSDEPDDLQATVVNLMSDLDTGDGADREDLIAEMDARYGTNREVVEEAIQDALMDGECYEPDDSTLKPI